MTISHKGYNATYETNNDFDWLCVSFHGSKMGDFLARPSDRRSKRKALIAAIEYVSEKF